MALRREARRLAAGDGVRPATLLQADAGQAQRVLRHGDVARGLELTRHGERALPRQTRQRHEQAGDVLRGHVARQFVSTGPQLPGSVQQRTVAPDGHTVRREHRVERRQRPLRQTPLHAEGHVRAERAHDRQQKAQCRAALAAEKVGVRGHFPGNGDDAERARAIVRDVRAEGAQAARRGSDVGRDAVALQRHGLRAERGTDEQAVRLRFRGRDAHAARARPG